MGNKINTKYDDNYCYIHADNITLSFSSKGHNAIGGYDLFFVEKENDSTWTNAKNYGYPINTVYDDYGFAFSYDNRNAFYATQKNNSIGKTDIYKIKILSFQKSNSTVIKGVIKNKKGEIVNDKIIHLTERESGKYLGQYKAGANGVYTFILTPGKKYFLHFDDKQINFSPKMITVPTGSSFSEIEKAINLGVISVID